VLKFTNVENGKQYVIEIGTLHMQKYCADHWIYQIAKDQEIGIHQEDQIFGLLVFILRTMEINGKMN
jgi:hypothetical protein